MTNSLHSNIVAALGAFLVSATFIAISVVPAEAATIGGLLL